MTFLRAIRDDLVEKKLWPVAVALLLALVAIPVLLTRGGDAAPAPPLPDPALAQTPVSGNAADPVVLAEAATAKARPTGRFKDPFRGSGGSGQQADQPVPVNGAAVPVTVDEPATPPAGGGGGGGAASSPGATTITPDPPASDDPGLVSGSRGTTPAPPADDATAYEAGYRVDVDWGPATAPRSLRDVTRLDALEAGDEPQLVFMGVRPDGRTALFLIVGDATGSGDARCRPSEEYCSLLELEAGDTQFLDLVTADGVRQYELYVDRVAEQEAASAAAAEKRLERVAKGGRRLVRETIDNGRTFVRRYVYATKLGVLKFVVDDERKAATRGALEAAE